jgi:hypothetical protein
MQIEKGAMAPFFYFLSLFFYSLIGAPAGAFTGAPVGAEPGSAATVPLIVTTLTGVLTAFELIVTDFWKGPVRLVSYLTSISDEAPGAIGLGSHLGTVHPQDPWQFEMIRGSLPVFVTLN